MGTRKRLQTLSRSLGDHPHAYGDKYRKIKVKKGKSGSSPRVWGQVGFFHAIIVYRGIIPTRMGTSLKITLSAQEMKDHPHAYGDKKTSHLHAISIRGSSPRVWGQAVSTYTTEGDSRIIPTRMGTRVNIK